MKNLLKVLITVIAMGAVTSMAQETPVGPSTDSNSSTGADGGPGSGWKHGKGHDGKHHHKKGFMLGVCVGQALAQASPPVIFTPGQKPSKENWKAIKAAKKSCREAFKAAKGSKPAA